MPPNVFKLKESGDIFTFKGGKPLLLQLGSLGQNVPGANFGEKLPGILSNIQQQTGIDYNKLPTLSVEDAAKRFIPGAHPNAFFDFAQTGSLADFTQPGEGIKTLTPQETTQAYQQRLQEKRTMESQTIQGGQQTSAAGYTGPSIVDFLNLQGKPSDFTSRTQLAKQFGIQNYTGTAEQNTQLLNTLRGQQSQQTKSQVPSAPEAPSIVPQAPQTQNLAPTATPSQDLTQTTTKDLLGAYGSEQVDFNTILGQIKTAFGFDESTKEIEKLDNQRIDEVATINDNPWLSETLRSKKVASAQDKYEKKRDALVDRLKLNQDLAGKVLDVYFKEKEYRKDILFKQLDLKVKELELDRKSKERNVKEVRGGLYDLDSNTWVVSPKTGNETLDLEDRLKITGQLRDDARLDPDIKVFPEVRQAYETIATQAERRDAVGDLTLLRLYAKLTDPTSSVREEEFESMESAQGALARRGVRLTKGQITGERLTEGARKQFVSAAKQIYDSRKRNYDTASDRIRQNAIDANINPDRVITDQPAVIQPDIKNDRSFNITQPTTPEINGFFGKTWNWLFGQ